MLFATTSSLVKLEAARNDHWTADQHDHSPRGWRQGPNALVLYGFWIVNSLNLILPAPAPPEAGPFVVGFSTRPLTPEALREPVLFTRDS